MEGLDAVSNRRIALERGCAPGLVHHYFPVAMDLLAEALQHVLMTDQEEAFHDAQAASDALGGLTTLLTRWPVSVKDDYGLLWLDSWSLARRQPQIRAVVDVVMKQGHARMEALIRRGVAEGLFITDDPTSVAWSLLTSLDGVIVHTSIGVNQGLVDVTRTIANVTEQQLGLTAGSLNLSQ